MNMIRYILPLVVSMLCARLAVAAGHDIELERTITFTVLPDSDGGYSLRSVEKVTQKYLSKRSTALHTFPIHEQYYDSVSDIRATYRGNDLGRSSFSMHYSADEDVFISDYKVHLIRFPDGIDTGETISYDFRRDYKSLAFLPVVLVPNIDYLSEFTIIVNRPQDVSVDFEFFFPHGPVEHVLRNDEASTTLRFSDVPESPSLPYFPFNSINAAVQIKLRRGDKALNPTTVADFTDWYYSLFDRAPTLDPHYDTLLGDRIRTAKTTVEKLRAIHDYVRTNIRYIADEGALHAIVPRVPSLVLDRGYGDCKDRAHLVSAIARKYGLDVYMTLVSTEPSPIFSGTYVSQYNHVICACRDGKGFIFFDPTYKYGEFGNLPESDIGATALVLDPKNPEKVVIPSPNDKVSIDIVVDASLDKPKEGSAVVVLRNKYFSSAQRARTELTGLDLENYLSNLVTSRFQKLSFDYFDFRSEDDSSMTFTATADIGDFLISSPTRMYVPQMPFQMVDSDILKREEDSLEIYYADRDRVSMTLRLATPGYSAKPDRYAIEKDPSSRFSAALAQSGPGQVTVTYDLNRSDKMIAGAGKGRYLEFCKDFLKSKKKMFTLTKE